MKIQIIIAIAITIPTHLYPQRLMRDAIEQDFNDVTDRRKFVKNLGIELQSVNGDEDDLREALLLAIGLVAIPDRDHSSAGALYPIIDSLDEMLWHFQWRYVTSLNVRRCQLPFRKKMLFHSLTGIFYDLMQTIQKLLSEQAMSLDEAMEQSSLSIYRRIGLQITNRPSLAESFALFVCEKDLQQSVSMFLPYVLPEIAKAYSCPEKKGNCKKKTLSPSLFFYLH